MLCRGGGMRILVIKVMYSYIVGVREFRPSGTFNIAKKSCNYYEIDATGIFIS